VVAGAGDLASSIGQDVAATLPAGERDLVLETFRASASQAGEAGDTLFLAAHGQDLAAFARGKGALAMADPLLLEVFLSKVAQALDNYQTFAVILEERNALIRSVSVIGETWGSHTPPELVAMQHLAQKTAQRLHSRLDFPGRIDDRFIFSIGPASLLHDVGQQALPQSILQKPGPLTPDERTIVQAHVNEGLGLLDRYLGSLKGTLLYNMARDIIAHHHERYDGSGYPTGLSGEALSVSARIVAVVDAFLAMTSPRPHRPPFSREETLKAIAGESGRKYDPLVVEAFLEAIEEY
jgi:HD-GYP domain-containing protein (c-di-GMP phosphodiesterase class II)